MVIKHKNQRVAVFIDTQNLYHSARHLYNAKVHFANLLEDAVAGRQLIRAISYVVNTETGEEQGFFEALAKIGIEIKTKDLQIFAGGAKKADWDVGMAIDAIKMAPKLDAVVLATGDGDFVPAVEHLKTAGGCQVEVIAFGRSSSARLKETVDEFTDMDEAIDRYTISSRTRRTPVRRSTSPRTTAAPRATTGTVAKSTTAGAKKRSASHGASDGYGSVQRLA
jgi:uncharacterized LabA/DUF88 family protein